MKLKKMWSLLLVFLLIFNTNLVVSKISLAATSEGNGTAKSPYLIKTTSDLYKIPESPSAYYKIVNDLDFKNAAKAPMSEFKGVLLGDGHTISNLKLVTGNKRAGLFSLATNAKLEGINFSNITLTAENAFAGTIASEALNTYFIDCTVSNSQISNASGEVGGLAGIAVGSTFYQCNSTNNSIKGNIIAGGIIGSNSKGSTLWKCTSTSSVESISTSLSLIGGLVGHSINGIAIKECFTSGLIKGNKVGGFIGSDSIPITTIDNSYSICSLYSTGTAPIAGGGFIGDLLNYSEIKPLIMNSYFAGGITGTNRYGLAPLGEFQSSYFDRTKTGLSTPSGSSRTTTQMYQRSNYVNWDFTNIWTIEEGKNYPNLKFMVKEPDKVPLVKISLQPLNTELSVGTSAQITVIYTPENATNKNVTWISSNPSIVSVDKNGSVKALVAGFCTIIAASEDGNHMAFCNITVKQGVEIIPVEKITLEPISAELVVGGSLHITPIITPANATNKNVTWFSTNPSVTSVDENGNVKALAAGYGTITAASEDGGHTAFCNIVVKPKDVIPGDNIALGGTASSNSTLNANNSPDKANDGDLETKWMAADSDYGIYLQIDFGQSKTFNKVVINEFEKQVDDFALQIWIEGQWVNIYSGNEIGEAFELNFQPVTSEKVRLMFYTYLNGDCPSIKEFEIYS